MSCFSNNVCSLCGEQLCSPVMPCFGQHTCQTCLESQKSRYMELAQVNVQTPEEKDPILEEIERDKLRQEEMLRKLDIDTETRVAVEQQEREKLKRMQQQEREARKTAEAAKREKLQKEHLEATRTTAYVYQEHEIELGSEYLPKRDLELRDLANSEFQQTEQDREMIYVPESKNPPKINLKAELQQIELQQIEKDNERELQRIEQENKKTLQEIEQYNEETLQQIEQDSEKKRKAREEELKEMQKEQEEQEIAKTEIVLENSRGAKLTTEGTEDEVWSTFNTIGVLYSHS